MDTFNESFDPDRYRLLSERRKIRRIRDGKERLHAQLRKESRQLARQIWKTAPVPLETPYQIGWMRYYVLRDDVRRDPRAAMYERILRHINKYTFSKNKQFTRKKGRKNRKANYVPIPQELKTILPSVFESPKFPLNDAEKALFRLVDIWHYPNRIERVYAFTEAWRFRLIVRPWMVTEMIPVNSELQSRADRIDRYFERRHIPFSRYNRQRWKGWRELEKEKERSELKNKPLHAITAAAENDSEAGCFANETRTMTTWEI